MNKKLHGFELNQLHFLDLEWEVLEEFKHKIVKKYQFLHEGVKKNTFYLEPMVTKYKDEEEFRDKYGFRYNRNIRVIKIEESEEEFYEEDGV